MFIGIDFSYVILLRFIYTRRRNYLILSPYLYVTNWNLYGHFTHFTMDIRPFFAHFSKE